jgi:Nucleotidyl transferase AbiEii toxin, Type IV TA system
MSLKDLATSINSRLSNLAQKQGVSFQNISTSFLIEGLVARFTSDKELASALVFKGGYVSLRVYNSSRFTIDLDALLLNANIRVTLEKTKLIAAKDLGDGVWFRFEQEIDLKTQGEYGGIRQSFRGGIGVPLKDLKRAQIINFDLGIGDPVTPFPIKKEMPELLGKGEISWSVYGWVTKDEGIALTQQGKVDAVVAISPHGHPFLRGRPHHAIS